MQRSLKLFERGVDSTLVIFEDALLIENDSLTSNAVLLKGSIAKSVLRIKRGL